MSAPKLDAASLIAERQTTHGDFGKNARISQGIKGLVRSGALFDSPVQAEAVDMIALKLSRIASGQAEHEDHWADIVGYATLALNALRNRTELEPTNKVFEVFGADAVRPNPLIPEPKEKAELTVRMGHKRLGTRAVPFEEMGEAERLGWFRV